MKYKILITMRTITTFVLTLLFLNISAQNIEYPYPSLSPKGNLSQAVGNTMVKIEYERPSVRKRQIFGGLVPWNKVWRTGAGHCTKISFDKNVIVGGQRVEAGNYSLFTIPNPKEWIIILNRDTSLSGSYNYDYKKDVARFIVIPNPSSRFYETLNFDIEVLPNDAKIFISWANVQVSFDVETTTDNEVEKFIQTELLTKKNNESDVYAEAAEYLFFQGENLSDAIRLAEFAIELDENNGWARRLKIEIYEKLKLYEDAFIEINKATKNVESRKYKNNEEERQNTLKELKSAYERISNLIKC